MYCPVCSEKFGRKSSFSYWKSQECSKCSTPLLLPIPFFEVFLCFLFYFMSIPIMAYLLQYLSITTWEMSFFGVFILIVAPPLFLRERFGELAIDDVENNRKVVVITLLILKYLFLSQVNNIPEYALTLFHQNEAKVIAEGEVIGTATYSSSGEKVAFAVVDKKYRSFLMVYDFQCKELFKMDQVPEKKWNEGIRFTLDEKYVLFDYQPNEPIRVKRIIFNITTGEQVKHFTPEKPNFRKSNFNQLSSDGKYKWERVDADMIQIVETDTGKLIKEFKGNHPRNFMWAPSEHHVVYVVDYVSLIGEKAQLCYWEF